MTSIRRISVVEAGENETVVYYITESLVSIDGIQRTSSALDGP